MGRPPELPTPAFRPVTRFLSVIRPDVTLCEISLESCVHVLSIIERSVREGYVNERDRAYLYNRYIFTIDTDTDDGTVQYGISGGPAVDGDGRVAGVIVMSNGYRILLVPIDEVQRLME